MTVIQNNGKNDVKCTLKFNVNYPLKLARTFAFELEELGFVRVSDIRFFSTTDCFQLLLPYKYLHAEKNTTYIRRLLYTLHNDVYRRGR
jgi:hypothetical protein